MDFSDFKISRITDDGVNQTVVYRFYEGDNVEEPEPSLDGEKLVTRYRRRNLVGEKIVTVPKKELVELRTDGQTELGKVSALPTAPTKVSEKDVAEI